MILDKLLMFDENIALTATRVSTNVIDLLRAGEDIGRGENLYWFVAVTTTLDSTEEDATLQVALGTDDAADLSSPVVIDDLPAVVVEASLAAGYLICRRIPPFPALLRYLGLTYTVGVHDFTTGKITAGITHDIQAWKAYASNFTSA